MPVDIIWSLVLAYYQREVSSFNVFLLMEKFCYCLNSLSEKFIQEKFFSAKTNLASASSSAARSGYSGAFFTATFEEEACDCDQSAAATTETVSPAAESKGDAPQSLFFAGSQNDSNDNSQINSSRGPGPGSKDTPQATNAVVSVVVANPVA
ncbi:MAG: hypothetical protein M1561_01850 [Gammaproteobacteria bacterium]|nr:hypothetical protein [Gammaproteobacteria bacterium]